MKLLVKTDMKATYTTLGDMHFKEEKKQTYEHKEGKDRIRDEGRRKG